MTIDVRYYDFIIITNIVLILATPLESNQGLEKPMKYILLWTNRWKWWSFEGCQAKNCIITTNRSYVADLKQFDAVVFEGIDLPGLSELPEGRSIHQKYVFYIQESVEYYPLCSGVPFSISSRFFNWTAAYRLDSTVPLPYFYIRDINGSIIGPRRDMTWIDNGTGVDEDLSKRLINKKIAAAWFVTHCITRGKRENYIRNLQQEMSKYKLVLDIYGACDMKKCSRGNYKCYEMLRQKYFFYLSFENALDEDYVTEKVLTAVQNDVVPIVYGGANYSWFLPPFSYLDARLYTPAELAARMDLLIRNPNLYRRFFWWHKYYRYDGEVEKECSLCQALYNEQMIHTYASYLDLPRWLHRGYRQYRQRCG